MGRCFFEFGGIAPFKMSVKYNESTMLSKENEFEQHTHSECEIYFNLSGDVSFMVEDVVYPVSRGSVIIARPYEYHHCIYHSSALHRHYWILFSCEGNEKYFDLFFGRRKGENNLIVLTPEDTDNLAEVFDCFIDGELSPTERYIYFFRVMDILNAGVKKREPTPRLSAEIAEALERINKSISEPIGISELADKLHMSINTLERHFKKEIGITPREYICQRRISNAAQMLAAGSSVIDACGRSGFPDYSHFIALFKRRFGLTPLQYKKRIEGQKTPML